MAHVVLFLLVAAEDTDFPDVRAEKTVQHCITETTCAACDQQRLVFKYTHCRYYLLIVIILLLPSPHFRSTQALPIPFEYA